MMDILRQAEPFSVRECMRSSLFADGSVVVFLLKNNPKWEFEEFSPNITRFTGYTQEEIEKKKLGLLDIIHPEDKEKLFKSFQQSRKERERMWSFSQVRLVRKDGSILWVELRFYFVNDASNRTVYFLGYMVDITKEIEEKNLFETVTDLVPVGIYLYEDTKFIYLNKKALDISGYSEEDIKNADIISFIYPEDRPVVEEILKKRREGNRDVFTYRIRIITKDEKIKWVQITSKIIYYEGKHLGIGIVQDIDKLVQLEFAKELLSKINRAMIASGDTFSLIEAVCDVFKNFGNFRGVLVCKVDGEKLTPVCRFSKNNFLDSIDCNEIPERKIIRIRQPVYISDISRLKKFSKWKELALANKVNSLIILPIKDGKQIRFIISLYIEEKNYFSKDVLEVFNEIANDISFGLRYMKKEEDLFLKEYYDSLTGIGNRNYFMNNLKKYINKNRYFYLVILDIYNFKYINEKFGKEFGDRILKEIADNLDRNLKYENVFRIGNDEFTIISTTEDVYILIDRIREILSKIKIEGRDFPLDYNIGVVKFPEDGKDPHEIVLKAERTLEIARKNGKNEVAFFDREKYESVRQTIHLEEKIENAIKNDEFILCFQPIVSVKDNTIKGVEVLVRWKDQKGNLILPSEFIPVAEKTGQIKEIDMLVIKKVRELLNRWSSKKILIKKGKTRKEVPLEKIRFSVNLTPTYIGDIISMLKSRQQFTEDDIKVLKKHLTFELTERQSLEIYTEKKNINRLRRMGFKIAIDDFGTGYSSLSYLAELNVNYIKIDMVFIQKMLTDKRIHRLVQSIINIAKIFGIKTIAEGVETYEQLQELKKLGCNMYQGYYYSPPINIDEFEKLLVL
ncbi:bifunctional diguanylate cyclase/phosphodiesterase [Persephonella sp.]